METLLDFGNGTTDKPDKKEILLTPENDGNEISEHLLHPENEVKCKEEGSREVRPENVLFSFHSSRESMFH